MHNKPSIPHKSSLKPPPQVSCHTPASTLPPTSSHPPKSLVITSSHTSFTNRQTNHAAKKLLFHHRQMKTKKGEPPQIIVADEHCAKQEYPTTKKWIKNYGLTRRHKKILDSSTKWLDDDLINASQKILAKQFEYKFGGAGFQTTLNGLCGNYTVETEEFIQILHTGSDHWLVITTIGTKHPEVLVYDSLYATVGDHVKSQIASLLCTQDHAIQLKFVNVVKQAGGFDCRVFAIAYATTLCLGESPGKYSFHQAKMRSHLKQCLENEHFTMFPTIKERRHTGNNIISQVHVPVYCSCRMPAMNPMIRCHSCHEWFHVGPCVKVTPKQMKDRKFKWNCTACC